MRKEDYINVIINDEDFVINKINKKSIIIDVVDEDLFECFQIIVKLFKDDEGIINKFEVYTGKEFYSKRFYQFGIYNDLNVEKFETVEEVIGLVYGNFKNKNIFFEEVSEAWAIAYDNAIKEIKGEI